MDKWYISTNNENPKPLRTVGDFKKDEEYLDEQFTTYEAKYIDNEQKCWPNTDTVTYHKCIICGKQFKRKHSDALKRVLHTDLFEKVCDSCFKERIKLFYKSGRGSGKTKMIKELEKMIFKSGDHQ